MPLALRMWLRPDYTPTGHDARIDYAVFGSFQLDKPIDRERYRSAQRPDGCELLLFDRSRNSRQYDQLFERATWKLAASEHPELAESAKASPQMVLLRGTIRDPQTLNYLRDAIGIVTYLLDHGGIAVFDPQRLHLWSPDVWREEIFATERPIAHRHVLIIQTPEIHQKTTWIHTRGMRLFGRPDLSVHNVGPHYQSAIVELFNRYIEYQANGGEILTGDVVTLDGLPPGGVCKTDPQLDHPDYENAHVEIEWPSGSLNRCD